MVVWRVNCAGGDCSTVGTGAQLVTSRIPIGNWLLIAIGDADRVCAAGAEVVTRAAVEMASTPGPRKLNRYFFPFFIDRASFTASATLFSAAVCFTFARSAPVSDFKAPKYCP